MWASHCSSFPCCGAWTLGHACFSSCCSQTLEHRLNSLWHELNCYIAYGVFPDHGSNLHLLHYGSNLGLPHCRQILYQLSHKGSPRILKWVAYSFSSRSSWPRNQTTVSFIAGGFFTSWAIRDACIGRWMNSLPLSHQGNPNRLFFITRRFTPFPTFLCVLPEHLSPKMCCFLPLWRFLLFFAYGPLLLARCMISCYLAPFPLLISCYLPALTAAYGLILSPASGSLTATVKVSAVVIVISRFKSWRVCFQAQFLPGYLTDGRNFSLIVVCRLYTTPWYMWKC